MGATIAGAFAGLLFALCGINKLFLQNRRMEMLLTMGRLFGSKHKVWTWSWISTTELTSGLILLVTSLYDFKAGMVVGAFPLLVICMVGYASVAHANMLRQWEPEGPLDWLACVMWTSEIQLGSLCFIAMT